MPLMDDEEDLSSPSNAIKLKYDVKKMVNAKWAYIMKNESVNTEAKACKTFLKLMDIEWKSKVTKLAYTVLMRRKYEIRQELPSPEDIQKLTVGMINELKTIELTAENFMDVVKMLQTRLMLYNKRRSGELEVIK